MMRIDSSNAKSVIALEVAGDDPEIRQSFLKHFKSQVESFIDAMANAYISWHEFDAAIRTDKKTAYVSAFIFSAINNHIVSMKLFLSGYLVAAGNLERQAIESIALAILSASPDLNILDRYMSGKYTTNKAADDLLKHHKRLNLSKEGVSQLKNWRDSYHSFSHPTELTLASLMSFSENSGSFLGASFDEGKLEAYAKEINGRVSLAGIFDNIVEGIKADVARW